MNYLDETEVSTELLHRKVLEKLGWYSKLEIRRPYRNGDKQPPIWRVDSKDRDTLSCPSGLKESDAWKELCERVPLDPNLVDKLRKLLTGKQSDIYIEHMDDLASKEGCKHASIFEIVNASPETHIRAMMQALDEE